MIINRASFRAGLFDPTKRAAYAFSHLVAYPVRLTLTSFLITASHVPMVFFILCGLDVPAFKIAILPLPKTATKNT